MVEVKKEKVLNLLEKHFAPKAEKLATSLSKALNNRLHPIVHIKRAYLFLQIFPKRCIQFKLFD